MTKTIAITLTLLLALVLIISIGATAQPALPSEPAQAPLSGAIMVLVAGGFFALYKLREKK